jgi:hypothetical protein
MARGGWGRGAMLAGAALLCAPALAFGAARAGATGAAANGAPDAAPLRIARITEEIRLDGDLSDPGWQGLEAIATWWEINPGDNVEPAVGNRAWLAYDDKYFYAAFAYDEPDPRTVRAPLGDRDQLGGQTDYGGVILDTRNDGKTAQMFLANANGLLYDAITSDASGEDSSPDFYWEAAGKVTERGWQLEIRIPFTSLRYTDPDPEQWGILLYRNRPRDFRYQYFTSRLPRDRNCFICNVRPLVGLEKLPTGAHWVAAPYVTGSYRRTPRAGLGTPLAGDGGDASAGLDVKWVPNPDLVFDLTAYPDFSQIESDTAQITANERFAIFQPERRPFFLESVDLFATPINAVYTRTITDLRWGGRVTGDRGRTKYTLLAGEDQGGGSVILPGPLGSGFALQDFDSIVAMGRVRRDFGRSFASFLYSGREIDGGGSNRVVGPDFQWRPNERTTVTAQFLWSATETPDRPELAEEWDGRELDGHAATLSASWSDGKWDVWGNRQDVGDGFRAFNGFVTQVGHRTTNAESGYTWRPEAGAVRRLRIFAFGRHSEDLDGRLLEKRFVPGIGLNALWNSFVSLEVGFEELRAITRTFERTQVRPYLEVQPGKVLARVAFEGRFGDEIDFANDRLGEVVSYGVSTDLMPTEHLRITSSFSRRELDVTAAPGLSGRLFTAQVARLRTVYSFDARSWVRLIGQWVATERRPELWTFPVARKSEDFAGSLVFAYKLNWQTVLYVGVGDAHALDAAEELQPSERQAFFKISYAFRN